MEVEGSDACVSVDKDGDRIPNRLDQCPNAPEDYNGYKDEDGCPDEAERQAMLRAQQERVEAQRQQDLQAQAEVERQKAEAQKVEQEHRVAEARRKREAEEEIERQRQAALQAADERRNDRSGRRTTGFVIGGLGLASGATSFVFMALAGGVNSQIKSGGFANTAAIQSADSTGNLYNIVSIATGAAGAVGFGVGTLFVLLNLPEADGAPATGLVLTPAPGGFALSHAF
jgi:hypothetical protein